jgi:DNA-binding NarL/FixJ family response regulator
MNKRIILVDDHPIVREGLAALLASVPGNEVVAQIGEASEVLPNIERLNPDLVIMDMMLGDTIALPLIKEIARRSPGTAILCISMYGDAAYAEQAALAGAMGYLTKSNMGRAILDAVESVLRGAPHFPADIQHRILRRARGETTLPRVFSDLSRREVEILRLIGQGKTKQQIAEDIGRSPNTVEAHRTNIKRKLNCATNAELMRFAILNLP